MRLRLKELREEQHLTQTQLAVRANKSPVTINQIETGIRNPSLKTLEELADALGVEVTDLFERVDPLIAEPPLPFAETQAEQRILAAFAAVLEDLHSRFASKTTNLPDPPQDDFERIRTEERLTELLSEFVSAAAALDEQALRYEKLYSPVNAIGRRLVPKASKWLHEYGETAQLDAIDEKVRNWSERQSNLERR